MMNRIRSIGGVTGITLLSRITGYARDKVLALVLGAGLQSDAFIVAFRIPNLFRSLLAEGSLHAAFIPLLSDYREKKDREALWEFARHALFSLTFIATAITVAGILLAPLIVNLFAHDFQAIPGKMDLTITLNRLMFPYLIFISIAGLFQGILNAHDRFFLPAATPIFLNVSIILCGVLIGPHLEHPAYGFAYGVLIGGFLQMAIQGVVARRLGLKFVPTLPFRHEGVWRLLKLMIPGLFALGIYQVNQLVGTRFASHVGNAAVSYLYYAYRLNHLIYGGVVVSLFTVYLPSLSREVKDRPRFHDSLAGGINLGIWITLPAAAGLWILGEPIIRLLFQGGSFTAAATPLVAVALRFYVLSLPAYAISKMLISAFFAHHDTVTPAFTAGVDLAIFTGACFILVPGMGHAGIALATTLGGYSQIVILTLLIGRHAIRLPARRLFNGTVNTLLATAAMVVSIHLLLRYFPLTPALRLISLGIRLSMIILIAAGLFFLTSYLLRNEACLDLIRAFRRKS